MVPDDELTIAIEHALVGVLLTDLPPQMVAQHLDSVTTRLGGRSSG